MMVVSSFFRTSGEFLRELFTDLYDNFTEVFLGIIVMTIVMVGGIIISWFIKKMLARLLVFFRFDRWAQEAGITDFLLKGGIKSQPSGIISKIVYWIFIVAFFSFGLNFVGITQFSEYALKVSNALPYVIVSLVIIVVGIILSNFISRFISIASDSAGFRYGDIVTRSVRVFLIIITFGIVLEYIGVGNTIITISFLILFGGVILTLSLALGIGLSHVIGDFIKEHVKSKNGKGKE